MIRSFCSADQLRRRSTVEIISDDMSLTVLKHVHEDSMVHQIPPRSARRQRRSPERSLTNDRDLRPQPLVKRQARLEALLERFGCPAVSLSEPFEDGLALLRVAEERGLEGIVSTRRDAPYRSGECRDWRKVKTPVWRVPLGTVATIRTRWSAQGLMASMNEYVSTV